MTTGVPGSPRRPTLEYAAPREAEHGVAVWRWRLIAPLLLACVYVPYAWILLLNYPWTNYRLLWLKAWPVLPGLGAAVFVRGTRTQFAVMGAITAVVLSVVYLVVRRCGQRPGRVIAVAAVVLVLSVANSIFAYMVFW